MALTTEQALRLVGLRAAYDKLISGQAVARVEFNGRVTEWAKADLTRLEAEIANLEIAAAGVSRRRGAVGFRF